jgi:hypothetical protein
MRTGVVIAAQFPVVFTPLFSHLVCINIHKLLNTLHLSDINSTLMRARGRLNTATQRLFMLHENSSNSLGSLAVASSSPLGPQPQQSSQPFLTSPSAPRLVLVPSGGGSTPSKAPSPLFDLLAISAHRCSAFFAEAAVLVLVLALLDRFMLKGRFEAGWVISAFAISALLLVASIATDFAARRWLKAH